MPSLIGAQWLNSKSLTSDGLRGKVVLVDFWTYSCVNCLRSIPYVKAWEAKYRPYGLVVIGVHAPEFDFEHDSVNVQRAMTKLGITYPVALDNDMMIWNAFRNQYWPAHYFIDAKGRIRYHHFGEGDYVESEHVIRQLLDEAIRGRGDTLKLPAGDTSTYVVANGVQAAAEQMRGRSPETYIGYGRAEGMVSNPSVARDKVVVYDAPAKLAVNEWALRGSWKVGEESAAGMAAGAEIRYRFRARDVNLVLGPAVNGRPVKFRVTIDGKAPGADSGMDVDADGHGEVTEHRLYQLIRLKGSMADERTIVITFEQPGVQAFAFTFG